MGFSILTLLTVTQRLQEIETAISEILTKGQSFALSGRTTTRADLATLYEERRRAQAEYNAQQYGKSRNLVKFTSPY